MALKRATRVGQSITLPLLCDPDMPRVSDAAVSLFVHTLDPSALGVDLAGVTHATIRGLSGADFAECDEVALRKLAALPKDERSDAAMASLRSSEMMRRGLVSIDGFDDIIGTPYPVETLARQVGSVWTSMRWEIAARIEAWSHMGESAGSSSAPSCGEPTSSSAGATSDSATATATATPKRTRRTTAA